MKSKSMYIWLYPWTEKYIIPLLFTEAFTRRHFHHYVLIAIFTYEELITLEASLLPVPDSSWFLSPATHSGLGYILIFSSYYYINSYSIKYGIYSLRLQKLRYTP